MILIGLLSIVFYSSAKYGLYLLSLVGLLTLISIFYSLKISHPFNKKRKRLKDHYITKNTIIAFAWSSLVFITYPIIKDFNLLLAIAVYTFLMDLMNSLACDIRDVKGDKIHGTETYPVIFGIKKTKMLIRKINFLALFTGVSYYLFGILNFSIIIASIILFFYVLIYMKLIDIEFNNILAYELIIDSNTTMFVLSILLSKLLIISVIR